MKLLNEKAIIKTTATEEVGGDIACVIACGSICYLTAGTGTAIAAAAYMA